MRISLKHTGDLPAYRKVFGFVLTQKHEITNPKAYREFKQEIAEVKQTRFSKFIQKCLEKLFPDCLIRTKAQFKHCLKGFVDDKILDKYIG